MQVKIEESWREALAPEFEKPYFASLSQRLHAEKAAGKQIYPPGGQIFRYGSVVQSFCLHADEGIR